jgi:hypothetical protein
MENFDLIYWITVIGSILGSAHGTALIIVNLTPTPKDNEWLGKIYRWFIEPLAGIIAKNKVKK